MPEKVGHWKCLVCLAVPWGWGIGGDLELHCEVIILAGSCSKTSAKPSRISLTLLHIDGKCFPQVLDLVTIQPPHFITKLGKIAGVLQLHCHLRSPLSPFSWHKKPPKVS